jgi:hypothetical protein
MYRVLMCDTLQKLAARQPSNPVFANHLANMKFGVPVTPTMTSGFRKWDEFMRQQNVKDYIGIDAYVMHPYLDSSNYFKGCNLSSASNASTVDLAKEFKAIRDTLEISYNKRFYKRNHVSLINALPAGTEVWYTEWDFNFDNSKLMKVGNTLLHAMFYYDAIMNFLDINANKNLDISCTKSNPVKMCNFHIPYAKNITWYPMVRFTNGYASLMADPNTTTNAVLNSVEYNATYYAQQLLAPVLNDNAVEYLNNTNGGFSPATNCSFRSFRKKDCSTGCCKDIVYIYFNNKSENAYKISLSQALSITNAKCVKATKSYLYANNLYASMGATTFRSSDIIRTDTLAKAADVSIQRVKDQPIPLSTFGAVWLPKYAVGYIKAEITMPNATCACTGPASRMENPASENQDSTQELKAESLFSQAPPKLYPNPVSMGTATLEFTGSKQGMADIRIYDLTGTIVKSFSVDMTEGQNQIFLDVSDLARSMYVVNFDANGLHFTEKLLVQ